MKQIFFSLIFLSVLQIGKSQNSSLQQSLNNGKSPRELMRAGIPKDSLMGKFYQGGYIFYIFPKDSTGLIMGPKDLSYSHDTTIKKIYWSCREIQTEAKGKKIGTGQENTRKILEANCTLYEPDYQIWLPTAAELCTSYKGGGFNDWFLPSQLELHEACKKLSFTYAVDFEDHSYWSSTEYDRQLAWIEHFRAGPQTIELFGQSYYRKFYSDYVRPIRHFKN